MQSAKDQKASLSKIFQKETEKSVKKVKSPKSPSSPTKRKKKKVKFSKAHSLIVSEDEDNN